MAGFAVTTEDRLGKEIDPGIKQSVVALRALGFQTDASCEGHLDHGLKAPWIDVGRQLPRDIKLKLKDARDKGEGLDATTEQRVADLKKELLAERIRLLDLLSEFYENRQVPIRTRLIIKFFGNSARLMNQGEGIQDGLTLEEQVKHLNEFRQEMTNFTDFLKTRFFRS